MITKRSPKFESQQKRLSIFQRQHLQLKIQFGEGYHSAFAFEAPQKGGQISRELGTRQLHLVGRGLGAEFREPGPRRGSNLARPPVEWVVITCEKDKTHPKWREETQALHGTAIYADQLGWFLESI